MVNASEMIKKGLLVTFGGMLLLVVSFFLYLFIFRVLGSPDGAYNFVAPLRVGYGVIWLVAVILIYRSNVADWVKAVFLAGGLGTFMITEGVQLYRWPVLQIGAAAAVILGSIYLLYRSKKKWYHYFAVILATSGLLFYM
ncbi:MAG TPA: hypothetical protein DHM90_11645 [Clostridiaceae bacterium]|nr:hypothetical protein [Clostridiaceae bacterium]